MTIWQTSTFVVFHCFRVCYCFQFHLYSPSSPSWLLVGIVLLSFECVLRFVIVLNLEDRFCIQSIALWYFWVKRIFWYLCFASLFLWLLYSGLCASWLRKLDLKFSCSSGRCKMNQKRRARKFFHQQALFLHSCRKVSVHYTSDKASSSDWFWGECRRIHVHWPSLYWCIFSSSDKHLLL